MLTYQTVCMNSPLALTPKHFLFSFHISVFLCGEWESVGIWPIDMICASSVKIQSRFARSACVLMCERESGVKFSLGST